MGIKSVNTHVKIVARNGKKQVVNKKFYLQNKSCFQGHRQSALKCNLPVRVLCLNMIFSLFTARK